MSRSGCRRSCRKMGCPATAEPVEEGTALVSIESPEPVQGRLVDIEVRSVTGEHMRPFIADIGRLQRNTISHLELHGHVVSVYRWERLFLRQGEGLDAAREEELPVRRQRGVWLAAAILRRIEAEEVGRAWRAAAEREDAIKVRWGVQALRGEHRQVLSH